MNFGEIEKAVNSCDKISNAICFYDENKDKIVCAYSGEIENQELIDFLDKLIPKYMIPNALVKKDELILNANGKIDRVKVKDDYFKGEL